MNVQIGDVCMLQLRSRAEHKMDGSIVKITRLVPNGYGETNIEYEILQFCDACKGVHWDFRHVYADSGWRDCDVINFKNCGELTNLLGI